MSNSAPNEHRKIGSGVEFLHSIETSFRRCEEQTDTYLERALATGSITTHEHLGTVISYLNQASSCRWGCQGGNHSAEMLIARCANYSIAAFKLARSGFYDEAVALIRSIGENTNLAFLFFHDKAELHSWQQASEKDRRKLFSPVAVRTKIEKRSDPLPINASRYGQLSEKAIHLVPGIDPQIYNVEQRAGSGGTFQELGLCFCLAELAYPLGILALTTVRLCGLESNRHGIDLTNAGEALSGSVAAVRARVNLLIPTYTSDMAPPNHRDSTTG